VGGGTRAGGTRVACGYSSVQTLLICWISSICHIWHFFWSQGRWIETLLLFTEGFNCSCKLLKSHYSREPFRVTFPWENKKWLLWWVKILSIPTASLCWSTRFLFCLNSSSRFVLLHEDQFAIVVLCLSWKQRHRVEIAQIIVRNKTKRQHNSELDVSSCKGTILELLFKSNNNLID